MSHTGALVGSDEVFSAALSRSGVLRVNSVSQLFAAAKVLSHSHYRVASDRLVIITNGGGPGVMAADRAFPFTISSNRSVRSGLLLCSLQSGDISFG